MRVHEGEEIAGVIVEVSLASERGNHVEHRAQAQNSQRMDGGRWHICDPQLQVTLVVAILHDGVLPKTAQASLVDIIEASSVPTCLEHSLGPLDVPSIRRSATGVPSLGGSPEPREMGSSPSYVSISSS